MVSVAKLSDLGHGPTTTTHSSLWRKFELICACLFLSYILVFQIDGTSEAVQRILDTATRRTSMWTCYQTMNVTKMQGQVGGLSKNKRPMMCLAPDYVMKHVRRDHRGFREVAFYEAVNSTPCGYTEEKSVTACGKEYRGTLFWLCEMFDMLAMCLAIYLQDPVIMASKEALIKSWELSKRESELLRRLSRFTPVYYGVVQLDSVPVPPEYDAASEMHNYYILLQDVTANFAKPCAIDIKMGTQTYEPNASEEKRARESGKYFHQTTFGMRIVSMRIFDPSSGYRSFPKMFGRGLESRAELLSALELFFSSGVVDPTREHEIPEKTLRTRVVTNILTQLNLLRSWFEKNDCVAFYASSLLLVYDGDSSRGDDTIAKMIDFGHVCRQAGGDPGYKLGLRTLTSLLTSLLNDAHTSAE